MMLMRSSNYQKAQLFGGQKKVWSLSSWP